MFMFNKKKFTEDQNVQMSLKKSIDFENTLVDIRKKSEKEHG